MSFVNNPNSTGIHFIGQTGETLRTSKPTPQSPASVNPPEAQDQVAQSSGATGQAKPINFLDTSPRLLQFQQALQSGKADELMSLLKSMSSPELSDLHLSVVDITKIADLLGKSDLTAALPLVGSYTDEEQSAVKRLIQHASHLSFNQKMLLLKENVGPGAVLETIQSARPDELKQLSHANKFMALSVLDPGNSIWGNVSGAGTELLSRRALANERLEDRLAGQILRSASNEQELRDMLALLNQFSRDDAVYHYVTSLSAQELNILSDGMKKELLQHLVDTGIQLPMFNLDLNNLANLDETLKMTFKEHVQAARMLYIALSPEERVSKSVQTLISKSDDLKAALSQIESELQRDQQAGKLSEAKIKTYRQQIEAIQQQSPDNPELKLKTEALLKTLTTLQQQLQQTAGQSTRLLSTLEQTKATTQKYAQALQNSQKSLHKLQQTLPTAQAKLQTAESKLIQQYTTLLELRKQLTQTEPRYTALLQEMEAALQNPRIQKNKLQQLESLNQQLRQLESRLDRHEQADLNILGEVQTTLENLNEARQAHQQNIQTVQQLNTDLTQAQVTMARNLSNFENQLKTLDTHLKTGRAQYQELTQAAESTPALEQLAGELEQIEKVTNQYRNTLQSAQSSWQQTQSDLQTLTQTQSAQASALEKLEPLTDQIHATETALSVLANTSAQTTQSLRSDLETILSQTRTFTAEWSSRLNSGGAVSQTEIQKCKADIHAHLASLETLQTDSPETVKQALEALKSLEIRILELERQLQTSQECYNQLNDNLKNLQNGQKSLEKELLSTQDLLSQTQQALSRSAAKITAIQSQITTFQNDLQHYSLETQSLEKQLTQTQEEALQARKNYGQGLISGAELTRQLQEHETREGELKQRLGNVRQESNRLKQQLQESKDSLTQAQTSLTAQQKTLTQKVEQANTLSSALQSARDKNLQELESGSQLLADLQKAAETQPVLKEKVQALEQLLGKLSAQTQAAGALIQNNSQTLIEILPIQRQTHQMLESIQATQKNLTTFEDEQLHPVGENIHHLESTVLQLETETKQIRESAEKLAHALREKDKPFAITEMQTQIEQLIQTKGLPAEQVQKLLNLKKQLEQIRTFRHQGEITIERHRKTRQDHLSIYQSACQSVEDVRTQLKLIETDINHAESELKNGQEEMLETQRQILEQRKKLGIHTSEYLTMLERYEQLLDKKGALSTTEIEELQALEQKLTQIEHTLGNQSELLKQRLESLNGLKQQLNGHIEQLRIKTQKLLELRTKLSQSLLNLKVSRGNLVSQNQELLTQRQQLREKLAELEQMLQQFPGSQELQEMKKQVAQELAALDQLLEAYQSELQLTDQDIGKSEQLIREMDHTLNTCRHIQEKLLLFVARINDLIQQGQTLLHEIHEMETEIHTETQAHIQQTQQGLTELTEPASQATPPGSKTRALSFQGLQQILGNSLPGFVSQQRQSEALREQTHQKQRDRLMKMLNQQIQEARQSEQNWKLKIEQQQTLENITEKLIQQQILGIRNTSGLNLVGINSLQESGSEP